jgi:Homeodomain-like domain
MPPPQEAQVRKRHIVVLSEEERARLHTMIGRGVAPASALTHARILLKANQGEAGPGWTDVAIGAALEVNPATVARVRMKYVAAGLDAAVYRNPPARQYRRRLDGQQEAHLVALTCSAPPEGRKRWRLRLLAERLVALQVVETISYETVRQALQQTGSSRGWPSAGASQLSTTPSSSGGWRTCWRSTPGPMIRVARRSVWTRPAASSSPR